MKTRRTTLPTGLFVVAALMSAGCLAKDNAREAALRAAELARMDATVKADAAALERLLDKELVYTHSNGDLESKAQFIASLTTGTRDYIAMEPTIEKLRVIGDVGLLHGLARVTVASGGNPSSFTITYDDAYVWKDGRWQLTSWRSTRLPDPAVRNDAGARAAVLARFDAALRADIPALESLLADDLDYCTLRGDCETKQQYIEEIRSGRLKYRSIVPTVDKVKLSGDLATVIGHVKVTAARDGQERSAHILYNALLAWRAGRWQHTNWASTIVEPSVEEQTR
jgi:ketosteroid isomerase-like protein